MYCIKKSVSHIDDYNETWCGRRLIEYFSSIDVAVRHICQECLKNVKHHIDSAVIQDKKTSTDSSEEYCHSQRDGDCIWGFCPQLLHKEPETSGRHCPLDTGEDEYQ